MKPEPGEVLFFHSAVELRNWLVDHHQSAQYAWIGFYKKVKGHVGLTYAEAVDEALCFGWIDGQLSGIDEHSYALRFTPRRRGSRWSESNLQRMAKLIAAGRLSEAGRRAYEDRVDAAPMPAGQYAFETRPAEMPDDLAEVFKANQAAWEFFSRQPPSYRKSMTWYVVSAKQQPTRLRRLAALIEQSAAGRRIDVMSTPKLSGRNEDG